MKYAIFALFTIIAMTASFSTRAKENSIDEFMNICTNKGSSQAFCKCSLEKFSDTLRKTAKKEFEKRKEAVDSKTKILLKNKSLDQERIDAVCNIHNLSVDYTRKITSLRGKGQADLVREYKKYKSKTKTDKMNLISSYNLDNNTNRILGGTYCQEKLTLAESEKDMTEDEGAIYPELERLLKFSMFHHSGVVMSMGNRSKCPK